MTTLLIALIGGLRRPVSASSESPSALSSHRAAMSRRMGFAASPDALQVGRRRAEDS